MHDCVMCHLSITVLLKTPAITTVSFFFFFFFCFVFYKHNHTPNGKKMVTGMQVVTTSQVQIIGCRSKAIFSD